MLRRLRISSSFLKKMLHSVPQRRFTPLLQLANPSKVIFTPYCVIFTKEKMQEIDLSLQEACAVGESAIIRLLDELEAYILEVCKEYKECLKKEIEVIREAAQLGPLSKKWDDLPEYRSLALELSQELDSFIATVHTIGEMVHKETIKYITEEKKCINLISDKFSELEKLIKKQSEEIKNLEAKVLAVKRESILKTS